MGKQRLCRICKKRSPWKRKKCPPGICKRCYHRHIWPERPAASALGRTGAGEPDELVLIDDLNPHSDHGHPMP